VPGQKIPLLLLNTLSLLAEGLVRAEVMKTAAAEQAVTGATYRVSFREPIQVQKRLYLSLVV